MNAPFTIQPQRKRIKLTVEDYLALEERGAFASFGKTELIEGQVYSMNAQHRPHARIKTRLTIEISRQLKNIGGLEAVAEGSIGIPPHNVPEPDIVITSEAEGEGLIPLGSVRLAVEVADATLRTDLKTKARIYATAGIPEYWVVDVRGGVVHQMWAPRGKSYAENRELSIGEPIVASTIAGLAIDTSTLV